MVEIKVKGVEMSLKEAEDLYNELKVLFDKPENASTTRKSKMPLIDQNGNEYITEQFPTDPSWKPIPVFKITC